MNVLNIIVYKDNRDVEFIRDDILFSAMNDFDSLVHHLCC